MPPKVDSISSKVPTLSFQEMLDRIRAAFSRSDCRVDRDELWSIINSYKSNPNDWKKYAFYDRHKYKRNLVESHEKYDIMILCWGPSTKSCIHDHPGSHCFMKILEGELVESRYAWPDENQENLGQEMSRLKELRVGCNETLYIHDTVGLHRVENPTCSNSASLHIYIPPFRSCKIFDPKTGKGNECKVSFYSKGGVLVVDDEDCTCK